MYIYIYIFCIDKYCLVRSEFTVTEVRVPSATERQATTMPSNIISTILLLVIY